MPPTTISTVEVSQRIYPGASWLHLVVDPLSVVMKIM